MFILIILSLFFMDLPQTHMLITEKYIIGFTYFLSLWEIYKCGFLCQFFKCFLNTISVRSNHVENNYSLFPLMLYNFELYEYITSFYLSFFGGSEIIWTFDCCHVNSISMNILVHISWHTYISTVLGYLEVNILHTGIQHLMENN